MTTNINRHVADQSDALRVCVGLNGQPLLIEEELRCAEFVDSGRGISALCFERVRVASSKILWPVPPVLAKEFRSPADSVEQSRIFQPHVNFRARAPLVEFLLECVAVRPFHEARCGLGNERFVSCCNLAEVNVAAHVVRVRELVAGEQPILHKLGERDDQSIAAMRVTTGIRRPIVLTHARNRAARGHKRKDLPDLHLGISEPVDKRVSLRAHVTDTVHAREGSRMHDDARAARYRGSRKHFCITLRDRLSCGRW